MKRIKSSDLLSVVSVAICESRGQVKLRLLGAGKSRATLMMVAHLIGSAVSFLKILLFTDNGLGGAAGRRERNTRLQ